MTIEIPNDEELERLKHLYDKARDLQVIIYGLKNDDGDRDCQIVFVESGETEKTHMVKEISRFGIHEKAVDILLPLLIQEFENICFEITMSATFHAPKIINTGD